MKLLNLFISSKIYIALAALLLTVETQVQLGLEPQWHPYLGLVFFATLLEYNLPRLWLVLTNRNRLNNARNNWINQHTGLFFLFVFAAAVGFVITLFLAKAVVLLVLAPIAVLTFFYSTPAWGNPQKSFGLRQIPFLKIFLIALTWSAATILLPVVKSGQPLPAAHILLMLTERFLFVFAITIPFDIRDMEADQRVGLKTIPLLVGAGNARRISVAALLAMGALAVVHYTFTHQLFIIWALLVSILTTVVFLLASRIQRLPFYHYGILDGSMFLQGLLVVAFYLLNTRVV